MHISTWTEPDLGGSYVGTGHDRPGGPAELKGGLDPGLAVVRYVYDAMRVDRPWSVLDDRGFTWWGRRLATRVWSEPGMDDDGIEVFRLVSRTAVLRDVPDSFLVASILDVGNAMAVTSALVHDRAAGTIDYVASQWVHAQSVTWSARLFSSVVAMQAAEAHVRAGLLAPLLGADPAFSGHPSTGDRVDADEMLGLLDVVSQYGRQPAAWAGQEMLDTFKQVRWMPGVESFTGRESGIELELRDRGHSARVTVSTEEPHPALGNGLLVRTSIDPRKGLDATWAAKMNRRELEAINHSMFLGSWVAASERPTFVTFYPNYVAGIGVGLLNLVVYAVNRATWAASLGEVLAPS
jgi:hypothetical protein